ncbi:DUF1080 domain-containing protein [Rubripirellula sp.]|jgi:hypothetical protein|nr:DUF1080 domain-containing protein [Rubripirellula sp.]
MPSVLQRPQLASSLIILLLASLITTGRVTAAEWINLIDNDSLANWKQVGGDASYTIKDGTITGKTGLGKNTFLTRGPYSNFELEFDVRCDAELNSGVQIRSHQYAEPTPQESKPSRIREKGEMYGYQCEITSKTNGENGCAGNFWDEGRRTKWLDEKVAAAEKQSHYKAGQWNHYHIVANGNHLQSYVNGELIADFHDDRDASGLIGLQVHSIKKETGPFEVSWKNIRIRKLSPE